MIILVFGLPGSGKTYLAAHLSAVLHATHINSDQTRKQMQLMGHYQPENKMQVYEEMLAQMTLAAKRNENVVIDATFYLDSLRQKFIDAAKNSGNKIYLIKTEADDQTIQERVSKSRPDSEADYEVYLKVKRIFEPVHDPHLTLKTDKLHLEDMLKKAADYVNQEI